MADEGLLCVWLGAGWTEAVPAPGNVLSLLMQSGWSGQAKVGLTGDDDLRVKVSAYRASWTEALAIDRTDGRVRFPQGVAHDQTGLPVA